MSSSLSLEQQLQNAKNLVTELQEKLLVENGGRFTTKNIVANHGSFSDGINIGPTLQEGSFKIVPETTSEKTFLCTYKYTGGKWKLIRRDA